MCERPCENPPFPGCAALYSATSHGAGPPQIRVPPRFQDTAIFEKGEEVVIKIPFTGFPKPSVKWLRGENEIKNSDKYKVEVGERHAILTIRNSDRMDDGPYRLELDNDLGTDSAIIKIAINGRPSRNS